MTCEASLHLGHEVFECEPLPDKAPYSILYYCNKCGAPWASLRLTESRGWMSMSLVCPDCGGGEFLLHGAARYPNIDRLTDFPLEVLIRELLVVADKIDKRAIIGAGRWPTDYPYETESGEMK